ncbi:MAG: TraX family protein [Clostridia bacterium]|nr:TraX family protein [Clostridia bacterium]
METKPGFRLNANHLKLIAILAMTVDHATDLFFPGFPAEPVPLALHFIGRLTAPIMWFFVCEGYAHTRNVKKYLLRLGLFAIVSHFAYCFAFGIPLDPTTGSFLNRTSVMLPLFLAVLALYIEDNTPTWKRWQRITLQAVLIFAALPADWSCPAVLAVLTMYGNRGNLKKQMLGMCQWVLVYGIVSFFFVSKAYALELVGVLMVWPLLAHYNGERGKAKWMKWFFYLYYPAHLAAIGLIRMLVYGNVSLLF